MSGEQTERAQPPRDRASSEASRAHVARWLVPALLIVVWLVVGSTLGPLAGKTSEVQKNDNSAFLPSSSESTEVVKLDKLFVPTETFPAILVYTRDGGLTQEDLAKINADTKAIADHFGNQLAAPPIGPIPSTKGGGGSVPAAQVILQFATTNGDELHTDVQWVRDQIQQTPGLQAHVTGPGGILADLLTVFKGIDGVLLVATGLIVLVILIIVYRSPLLPLIVLGSAVLALGAANGVVYLLAKHDVLTLNGQSQGILDVLVLGAATDYALLLVARYREELRRHRRQTDAIWIAWRAAAAPIAASGGTVILALLCLLISDLKSNKGLGPIGAIGIACAVLASLTFLPAVLALVGRVAFWPFRPRYDSRPMEMHGVWAKIATYIGRRSRLVWVAATLALLVLSLGLVQLKASGIPQTKGFSKTVDSTTGQDVLSQYFPAGSGSPAEIIVKAEKLEAVLTAARGVQGVAAAHPFSGAGNSEQSDTEPVIVNDLARVDATLTADASSPQAFDTIRALRQAVHAVPGAEAKVGGFSAINLDVQDTAKRDRSVIIPIALVVVFFILVALLRAVFAPLLLVATVVLSFFATLGVCGVAFHSFFGFAGEDSSFPLFAFIFLVALGVDYNIFLMTRVREEAQRDGHRQGVLTGLTVTGGVITSAGVVLAATFAALSVLPLVFLVEISFAVAFGVLLDTLVVRSLLVPAITLDIGKFVWWPGKLRRGPD
jgi:RND superfamily putative drug exporter